MIAVWEHDQQTESEFSLKVIWSREFAVRTYILGKIVPQVSTTVTQATSDRFTVIKAWFNKTFAYYNFSVHRNKWLDFA